ncbi:hypothetical protein ACLOJK_016972 [Asimina triloba]
MHQYLIDRWEALSCWERKLREINIHGFMFFINTGWFRLPSGPQPPTGHGPTAVCFGESRSYRTLGTATECNFHYLKGLHAYRAAQAARVGNSLASPIKAKWLLLSLRLQFRVCCQTRVFSAKRDKEHKGSCLRENGGRISLKTEEEADENPGLNGLASNASHWFQYGGDDAERMKYLLFLIRANGEIIVVEIGSLDWGENFPINYIMILHGSSTNKNALKALIAAEYAGVNVELAKNFEMGVSNKTPEYLKLNPIGKVPLLETPDGPIFESNAIARYVARVKGDNTLFGSSLIEYAEEVSIAALKRALAALNTHLAANTYLVGHSVTLADIVMTCNLFWGFIMIMTKDFTSEFPHVERYFWTMVNQPQFHKVMGEVKQAESVPPVKKSAPAKEAPKPKAKDEPKKEVKKETKKEPAKPKAEDAEEEEAPKPKPKNPLDLLPPSKMILDEWKRLYSNTKTNFREVAIKGFWDMYDPEGYSLWFCDYKYNDENTVSFVTLNKVSGFLQRMDLTRKYAFGKMLVIGSDPPYKVKGLWLFRGQDIPQFVLDECYDMELYDWRKVDISDEAQKERVNQMIEDQEPFEGEALLDAKCFK